jgi:UDP-N-acetylmuramate dehydrogenase
MTLEPQERSLAEATTLRIGGWTDRFYEVDTTNQLQDFISHASDPERAVVIGRGSNTLFPEGRFERPVLKLSGEFEEFHFGDRAVRAGAAVFMPELALEAAQEGYTGLEWAAGVPGSVGGAVAMNAGAYGCRTREVLEEISVVTYDGSEKTLDPADVEFDYRYCELREEVFIVEATCTLERDDSDEVVQKTKELLRERRREQPVGQHSAGCVFKNVNGHSAGRLIDEAGMKGVSRGDVEVSPEHANYFINHGDGTYRDMVALIEDVQEAVQDEFDYKLETELRIVRENN